MPAKMLTELATGDWTAQVDLVVGPRKLLTLRLQAESGARSFTLLVVPDADCSFMPVARRRRGTD